MVEWLGFDWQYGNENNRYFASDYFDYMYQFAQALVQTGLAYVDEQSADEMRATRGTLPEKGTNSPWRDRSSHESPRLTYEWRAGNHPYGSMEHRTPVASEKLRTVRVDQVGT